MPLFGHILFSPYIPTAVTFLVRGVRSTSDFEYEFSMASVNRKLTGVETVFLTANDEHIHISSSIIRQVRGACAP